MMAVIQIDGAARIEFTNPLAKVYSQDGELFGQFELRRMMKFSWENKSEEKVVPVAASAGE